MGNRSERSYFQVRFGNMINSELAYVHPELIRNKSQAFLNYGYLDKSDRIWLCCKDSITWYMYSYRNNDTYAGAGYW